MIIVLLPYLPPHMTIGSFPGARIIVLMIGLPYPESLEISYHCRNFVSTRWEISDEFLCNRSLFAIRDKDRWEILFSDIRTLPIFLGKIMNLKEHFCECLIVSNCRIIPHFHCFDMTSSSSTDLTIFWILSHTTCIADRGREHSLNLSEIILYSPETSRREDRMTNILHISIRTKSKWEWISAMTSITRSELLTMEYMSNMTSATLTCDLSTTTITIKRLSNITRDSFFKWWPSASRIELCITRKERKFTLATDKYSSTFFWEIFPCTRIFCTFINNNIFFLRCERMEFEWWHRRIWGNTETKNHYERRGEFERVSLSILVVISSTGK